MIKNKYRLKLLSFGIALFIMNQMVPYFYNFSESVFEFMQGLSIAIILLSIFPKKNKKEILQIK